MRRTRNIGKRRTPEQNMEERHLRPVTSRLSSKTFSHRMPFHEPLIFRTKHNTISEITDVQGLIVTFKTRDGITYRLDMEKTFDGRDLRFERQMRNPEIFSTLKVEHGCLAFMDKDNPVNVHYPDGDRKEIMYNLYFEIDDCMDLLEKVSD